MKLPNSFTPFAHRLLALALGIALSACATGPHVHPLTEAQLAERGTHRYPSADVGTVTNACARALAALGYDVVTRDEQQGVVKTAPKTFEVRVVGNGYYAQASEDGLAWNVQVEGSASGAVLHATPRAFRNGSEIRRRDVWVAEAIDDKFADLWSEMDGALSAKPLAAIGSEAR